MIPADVENVYQHNPERLVGTRWVYAEWVGPPRSVEDVNNSALKGGALWLSFRLFHFPASSRCPKATGTTRWTTVAPVVGTLAPS